MNLKADLMRLEAYAGIRSARVELVETHISWVFLLDRDVFKVKKPVSLGFLDFRTIEQRAEACEAEVRLNARLAPGVYRAVVAVREDGIGRACIGGSGKIVDWAVHMHRLPDDGRADKLLERGSFESAEIDALAKKIAAFHAAEEVGERESRYGAPEVIRSNIEENFAQARSNILRYVSLEEAWEIERWQAAFVDGHQALFEQRMRDGRVRDGHGDLRLEHVYLSGDGALRVIDCIEFNERFRFGDVCSDIAFLTMDLAGRGRVDLAERFLASYAREANDHDLYALVDFYESYRAFVRGKVSAMVAADDGVAATSRQIAEKDARHYFLLALSANRRPLLAPVLVAVGGILGSGKSTVAERIASELGAPIIDTDRTRKAMLGVEATHPLQEKAWLGAYDPAVTEKVYAEVFRRAGVVLASGRPVVVDASFGSRTMRQAARALSGTHFAPFRFVECCAAPALCRTRLSDREHTQSVSDGRLEIFDSFCARFQAVTELPPPEHIALDTARPIDEVLADLRSRLDTWPEGLVA